MTRNRAEKRVQFNQYSVSPNKSNTLMGTNFSSIRFRTAFNKGDTLFFLGFVITGSPLRSVTALFFGKETSTLLALFLVCCKLAF